MHLSFAFNSTRDDSHSFQPFITEDMASSSPRRRSRSSLSSFSAQRNPAHCWLYLSDSRRINVFSVCRKATSARSRTNSASRSRTDQCRGADSFTTSPQIARSFSVKRVMTHETAGIFAGTSTADNLPFSVKTPPNSETKANALNW